MKGKGKGKQIAGKAPVDKNKRGFDDDKTGGGRKRKNPGVIQFFEDEADDFDDSDDSEDSDFSDDSFEDEFETLSTTRNESSKGQSSLPFMPKVELVDEEEYDRMMEERFKDGSRFFPFTGDDFDDKPMEPNSFHPAAREPTPTIWKVKCTVGRERLSAFCLMQKFVHLKSLGTNLQIISAFAVDHMKGFVYIEAEKQCEINEACQGISGIYVTRVQPVPKSEVFHLFSFRSRNPEISVGMWARIKSGNYKGDLGQVMAVNDTRTKVTVKLIPRIDLQALAAKFGGGYSRQKIAVSAPRLISSSELEEFRPLIQIKRDRDTGKVFEVLDGMMLKDGYVYKKVSPDSLSLWGVVPTEEEQLKFGHSENNESNDLEWLSQIYGDKKKKRVIRAEKGDGKGESSSGSGVVNGFELYDLVCFRQKEFGVIIGMDKDDTYKILKESSEGPVAVTVEKRQIKSALLDLKLSARDHHGKTVLVEDHVRIVKGPSEGKQGIVRHIYRGIVFLYDGSEEENGGYFTAKANMCEKIKLAIGGGKDSEPGPLVFDDQPSSPRSPLSPEKPWQARENNREFNNGDKDGLFTIGQTLRIRIGPLKGYLCRVTGIRRSDVTVKLDSQQKFLTVKCEHLSEVQGKSTAMPTSGDPDSSLSKPFDFLGTEGSSGGWMDVAGTSTGGGGWNVGGGGPSTGGAGWNVGGTAAETTEGGGWTAGGGGKSTGGNGWNVGGKTTETTEVVDGMPVVVVVARPLRVVDGMLPPAVGVARPLGVGNGMLGVVVHPLGMVHGMLEERQRKLLGVVDGRLEEHQLKPLRVVDGTLGVVVSPLGIMDGMLEERQLKPLKLVDGMLEVAVLPLGVVDGRLEERQLKPLRVVDGPLGVVASPLGVMDGMLEGSQLKPLRVVDGMLEVAVCPLGVVDGRLEERQLKPLRVVDGMLEGCQLKGVRGLTILLQVA